MLTPRLYQQQAIELIQRQNLLLSDECGLGKTLTAIEAAKLLQAKIGKPVLIIVPKTIKSQWYQALINQGICADTIVNIPRYLGDAAIAINSFILTHYEELTKYIDQMANGYFSLVIVDECHKIKNRKAQRTVAIKRLRTYRRVGMSGTPYDRNPADIHSILQWLEPDFFTSYWRFFDAHINYQEITVRNGQKVKTIVPGKPLKDAERFARTIRPFTLKRTKKEVRPDLPDRIDQYIDLEMTSSQAQYYQTLLNTKDLIVEFDELNETIIQIQLTRILRQIQLTTDPTLLGLTEGSVKLDWVREWIEDNNDQSVIIFTRFRDTAIKLHKLLNEAQDSDRQFKLIIGGTKRPEITVNDRYIIGTIASMGEGLDLPHIDHAIMIDVEWSSILMAQALDRIHRINIDNVKHVYYLRCINTIDQLVHLALTNKWSTKELVDAYLKGYYENNTIN